MSNFEKIVRQKFNQIQEERISRIKVEELDKRRRIDEEATYFDKIIAEFENDTRYLNIISVLKDSKIRDAVSFMFQKTSQDDFHDHEPLYTFPIIDKEDFLIERGKPGFNKDVYYEDKLVGNISFDSGYYYLSGGGEDPGGSGYDFYFRMSVKNTELDGYRIKTTFSEANAHGECWKKGFSQSYHGEYSSEGKKLFDELSWIVVNNIDGIIEHLASGFINGFSNIFNE